MTVASTVSIGKVKWSRTVWNTWLPFVLPPIVAIVLIIVVPTIQLIANSFYRWSLLSGMKRFDGLGQYVEVLSDSLFTGSLFRTLVYTVVVVALELIFGMAIALLFNRDFPGIRAVRTMYLTPMLMVPIMVGLLWSLMYQPSIGVVNFVLGFIGIEPVHWLSRCDKFQRGHAQHAHHRSCDTGPYQCVPIRRVAGLPYGAGRA